MKKLLVLMTIFLVLFILGNYLITPTLDYSIIKYVSYSSLKNYNLDSQEEIEEHLPNIVIVQLQLDYQKFDNKRKEYEEGVSLEEVKKDRREFKTKAKKFYLEKNKKVKQNLLGCYQDLFVSSYSPFIDITYDLNYFNNHKLEILSNISKIKGIKNISVIETYQETTNYIDVATYDSGVYNVYNNRTVTGEGVSIGILESGIVDLDDNEFQTAIIYIRDSAYNLLGVREHTTQMAKIIAGTHGIAPDATIYNAFVGGSVSDEIEWMLDNDVDIINMSCGFVSNLGTYDSYSAYIDYISSEYTVTFVVAAGNYGSTHDLIDNPGLAYNAITVGSRHSEGAVSDFSSYIVTSGPIKPTILTVGHGLGLKDGSRTTLSGTSPACALCSGYLALILEAKPFLANNRERLFALMVANAVNTSYQTFNQDNGFSVDGGAGLFHYQNMIDNYSNSATYSNSNGTEDSVFYTRTVSVQAGQTLRAAIATIATSDGTVNGITFTDYDVFIKDSNGNILAFANSYNSVIDVVTYTALTSGNYKIEIYQSSALMTSKDYIGFAYRIY